jgi:hypothetical protein
MDDPECELPMPTIGAPPPEKLVADWLPVPSVDPLETVFPGVELGEPDIGLEPGLELELLEPRLKPDEELPEPEEPLEPRLKPDEGLPEPEEPVGLEEPKPPVMPDDGVPLTVEPPGPEDTIEDAAPSPPAAPGSPASG